MPSPAVGIGTDAPRRLHVAGSLATDKSNLPMAPPHPPPTWAMPPRYKMPGNAVVQAASDGKAASAPIAPAELEAVDAEITGTYGKGTLASGGDLSMGAFTTGE